jgi:hypothetical protein
MFKSKKYQNLLGLNDLEFDEYLKRTSAYYKSKNSMSKAVVNSHYFILEEILIASSGRRSKERKFRTKNEYILKYLDEIVELKEVQKFGATKISNAMKLNHNVKISKSSIERFFKNNESSDG